MFKVQVMFKDLMCHHTIGDRVSPAVPSRVWKVLRATIIITESFTRIRPMGLTAGNAYSIIVAVVSCTTTLWILVGGGQNFLRGEALCPPPPAGAGAAFQHHRLAACTLLSRTSCTVSSILAILAPSHGILYCYDIPRYSMTLAILVSSHRYRR